MASREAPDNPADLLPEDSVLTLDDYLEIVAAVSTRLGFQIAYHLQNSNQGLELAELEERIESNTDTIQSALTRLVDCGGVERRLQLLENEQHRTYYRSTILAETVLTRGPVELMRREWDFAEVYDSDSPR